MKFKIFISSVQKEFTEERNTLFEFINQHPLLSKHFDPFLFEYVAATDRMLEDIYLDEVQSSDVYLGLIGQEYGFEDAEGVSPTEREYDAAKKHQKGRWIFLKSAEGKIHPKEQAFIKKLSSENKRVRYNSIESLKQEVEKSAYAFLETKGVIQNKLWDDAYHLVATLGDIDPTKVERFIKTARSKRDIALKEGSSVAELLTHLHMIDPTGRITNSALMVFGETPQKWFPTSIVKCALFNGIRVSKPIPDSKVWRGDVFQMIDEAFNWVMNKLDTSTSKAWLSADAVIEYEIPASVIREAIVNAVAHRNYTSAGSVQIMVFADRVDILNPGALPKELDAIQIRKQHASYPMNPLLADALFKTGYIEQLGSGVTDMINDCRQSGLRSPDISTEEGFKITLWRPTKAYEAVDNMPSIHDLTPIMYDSSLEALWQDRISAGQVQDRYRSSTSQVRKVVIVLTETMKRSAIQKHLSLVGRDNFIKNYLNPALEQGFVTLTIPDKPSSSKQRYRLTEKGRALQKILLELMEEG